MIWFFGNFFSVFMVFGIIFYWSVFVVIFRMVLFFMNFIIFWGFGFDSGIGSVVYKRLIFVCEGEIEVGIVKVGVIKVVEVVEEWVVIEVVYLIISWSVGIVEDCR